MKQWLVNIYDYLSKNWPTNNTICQDIYPLDQEKSLYETKHDRSFTSGMIWHGVKISVWGVWIMTDKQDKQWGKIDAASKCVCYMQMYFLNMRKLPNHHRNLMIVDSRIEIVCSFHYQLSSIKFKCNQNITFTKKYMLDQVNILRW